MAHVEALLALRGVPMPIVYPAKCKTTARRGHMRLMLLEALRKSPMTRKELVAHIGAQRPNVPPERIYWRVDAALSKARTDGLVKGSDGVWWLAP